MKILVFTQYFWPETFRINDLATSWREQGHQVTVLTGMPNYPTGHFFDGYGLLSKRTEWLLGVKIFRVPLIPRGKGGGFRLFLNYLSFAVMATILAPFRLREKYDCIFIMQYSPVTVALPAIFYAKLSRTPTVMWIQDLWPESLSATGAVKSPLIIAAVRQLVRCIYRHINHILVQSRGFILQTSAMGVDASKVSYFPNWAEDLYRPVSEKPSHLAVQLPPGFKIMFAGNIGAAQSFDTILDAAEKLKDQPEIQWIILGDGRLADWVKDQVVKRQLSKVHLLGRYPMDRMPYLFSQADAMLVTLKDESIFALTIPSKIQSYMACGKPIIAALHGEGAKVIEESGAGIVCAPECGDSLAQAVLRMYNLASAERHKLGDNGLAYYKENFQREKLLEYLENLLQKLIAGLRQKEAGQ